MVEDVGQRICFNEALLSGAMETWRAREKEQRPMIVLKVILHNFSKLDSVNI